MRGEEKKVGFLFITSSRPSNSIDTVKSTVISGLNPVLPVFMELNLHTFFFAGHPIRLHLPQEEWREGEKKSYLTQLIFSLLACK